MDSNLLQFQKINEKENEFFTQRNDGELYDYRLSDEFKVKEENAPFEENGFKGEFATASRKIIDFTADEEGNALKRAEFKTIEGDKLRNLAKLSDEDSPDLYEQTEKYGSTSKSKKTAKKEKKAFKQQKLEGARQASHYYKLYNDSISRFNKEQKDMTESEKLDERLSLLDTREEAMLYEAQLRAVNADDLQKKSTQAELSILAAKINLIKVFVSDSMPKEDQKKFLEHMERLKKEYKDKVKIYDRDEKERNAREIERVAKRRATEIAPNDQKKQDAEYTKIKNSLMGVEEKKEESPNDSLKNQSNYEKAAKEHLEKTGQVLPKHISYYSELLTLSSDHRISLADYGLDMTEATNRFMESEHFYKTKEGIELEKKYPGLKVVAEKKVDPNEKFRHKMVETPADKERKKKAEELRIKVNVRKLDRFAATKSWLLTPLKKIVLFFAGSRLADLADLEKQKDKVLSQIPAVPEETKVDVWNTITDELQARDNVDILTQAEKKEREDYAKTVEEKKEKYQASKIAWKLSSDTNLVRKYTTNLTNEELKQDKYVSKTLDTSGRIMPVSPQKLSKIKRMALEHPDFLAHCDKYHNRDVKSRTNSAKQAYAKLSAYEKKRHQLQRRDSNDNPIYSKEKQFEESIKLLSLREEGLIENVKATSVSKEQEDRKITDIKLSTILSKLTMYRGEVKKNSEYAATIEALETEYRNIYEAYQTRKAEYDKQEKVVPKEKVLTEKQKAQKESKDKKIRAEREKNYLKNTARNFVEELPVGGAKKFLLKAVYKLTTVGDKMDQYAYLLDNAPLKEVNSAITPKFASFLANVLGLRSLTHWRTSVLGVMDFGVSTFLSNKIQDGADGLSNYQETLKNAEFRASYQNDPTVVRSAEKKSQSTIDDSIREIVKKDASKKESYEKLHNYLNKFKAELTEEEKEKISNDDSELMFDLMKANQDIKDLPEKRNAKEEATKKKLEAKRDSLILIREYSQKVGSLSEKELEVCNKEKLEAHKKELEELRKKGDFESLKLTVMEYLTMDILSPVSELNKISKANTNEKTRVNEQEEFFTKIYGNLFYNVKGSDEKETVKLADEQKFYVQDIPELLSRFKEKLEYTKRPAAKDNPIFYMPKFQLSNVEFKITKTALFRASQETNVKMGVKNFLATVADEMSGKFSYVGAQKTYHDNEDKIAGVAVTNLLALADSQITVPEDYIKEAPGFEQFKENVSSIKKKYYEEVNKDPMDMKVFSELEKELRNLIHENIIIPFNKNEKETKGIKTLEENLQTAKEEKELSTAMVESVGKDVERLKEYEKVVERKSAELFLKSKQSSDPEITEAYNRAQAEYDKVNKERKEAEKNLRQKMEEGFKETMKYEEAKKAYEEAYTRLKTAK